MNNQNIPSEWLINNDFNNQRIDYFLKKKYPNLNFPSVCRILRKGLVKINDKKVKNSYILKNGDLIRSEFNYNQEKSKHFFSTEEQKNYIRQAVIFENENYLIFNKPPGLAVQGGSKITFNLDVMLDIFKNKSKERPSLVHRLDKPTSGILIISKNIKTSAYFGKLFKKRKIEKTYLALVEGTLKKTKEIIDTPIRNKEKIYDSITRYKVIDSYKNQSLVIIKPLTGRKHQIRKHFNSIGYPIVGDTKFLNLEKKEEVKNLFLHSFSISFMDINENSQYYFAKPPEYFEKAIREFNFKGYKSIKKVKF